MAAINSSVAGYLAPAAPGPLYDDAFADFLQSVIAGISALPGKMVRPRWQPNVPELPPITTDWMAFGVIRHRPDWNAVVTHNATGQGTDRMIRQEAVEVMVSSYGPHAAGNLSLLSGGLQIEQNRAEMDAAGVKVTGTGEIVAAPTLIKELWRNKFDMRIDLTREIRRTYPILNLLSAHVTLHTEGSSTRTTQIDVTA